MLRETKGLVGAISLFAVLLGVRWLIRHWTEVVWLCDFFQLHILFQ